MREICVLGRVASVVLQCGEIASCFGCIWVKRNPGLKDKAGRRQEEKVQVDAGKKVHFCMKDLK